MMFEELPSILPLHFFSLALKVKYLSSKKKLNEDHLLLNTCKYLDQEPFANIYLGWNEDALYFKIFMDLEERAEINLFFDTRDAKTGYMTKFCHHFLITLDPLSIKEITRFRNDETHPIADPQNFKLDMQIKKKTYILDLSIPAICLYGFDCEKFDRLGFSYKIVVKDKLQDFSLSSKEFSVERFPRYWATLELIK